MLKPSQPQGQGLIFNFFKKAADCTPEELAATARARASREQLHKEVAAARAKEVAPAKAMQAAWGLVKPRKVSAKTAAQQHINPLAAFQELAGFEDDEEEVKVQEPVRGAYNEYNEYHFRCAASVQPMCTMQHLV